MMGETITAHSESRKDGIVQLCYCGSKYLVGSAG